MVGRRWTGKREKERKRFLCRFVFVNFFFFTSRLVFQRGSTLTVKSNDVANITVSQVRRRVRLRARPVTRDAPP